MLISHLINFICNSIGFVYQIVPTVSDLPFGITEFLERGINGINSIIHKFDFLSEWHGNIWIISTLITNISIYVVTVFIWKRIKG